MNQFLRQRAAHAFAQHRNLREQIDARFEIGLLLPFPVDAFVASAHADDAVILAIEHFGAGKLRKDVHARRFALLSKPGCQTVQRNDVIAMIVEWWRVDRRPNRSAIGEIHELIVLDLSFQRRAFLFEVRDQFSESARIHHGAGERMRANRRSFFDYRNLSLAERVVLFVVLRD